MKDEDQIFLHPSSFSLHPFLFHRRQRPHRKKHGREEACDDSKTVRALAEANRLRHSVDQHRDGGDIEEDPDDSLFDDVQEWFRSRKGVEEMEGEPVLEG